MDALTRIFGIEKPLIAMCHLGGLPGRPRHDVAGGIDAIAEALRARPGGAPGRRRRRAAVLQRERHPVPAPASAPRSRRRWRPSSATSARDPAPVRRRPAVGSVRPSSPSPARPARRSSARSSPACTTATWACSRPTSASSPATGTRSAPTTSPCSGTSRPSSAGRSAGRTVADRARGAEYLGVDALLISGPAAGVAVRWPTCARPRRRSRHPGARQHRRQARDGRARSSRSPTGRSSARASRSTATPGTRSTPTARSRMVELVAAARESTRAA